MRCAIIEAETREEVMKEMEERMQSVERMYARRLMNEVCSDFCELPLVVKHT
jgi:kinesin family member 20